MIIFVKNSALTLKALLIQGKFLNFPLFKDFWSFLIGFLGGGGGGGGVFQPPPPPPKFSRIKFHKNIYLFHVIYRSVSLPPTVPRLFQEYLNFSSRLTQSSLQTLEILRKLISQIRRSYDFCCRLQSRDAGESLWNVILSGKFKIHQTRN